MSKRKWKVYSFDDWLWIVAESRESAIEFAKNHIDDFEVVSELSISSLEKLAFHADDGVVRPFKEQLELVSKTLTAPDFFAFAE